MLFLTLEPAALDMGFLARELFPSAWTEIFGMFLENCSSHAENDTSILKIPLAWKIKCKHVRNQARVWKMAQVFSELGSRGK